MHSENKECDDSVMSTSSTLLEITEKGEQLLNLHYLKVLGFGWLGCLRNLCYIHTQTKAGNGCLKSAPPWKEDRIRTATNARTPERRVDTFGIKSLENHVTNMTFLESK